MNPDVGDEAQWRRLERATAAWLEQEGYTVSVGPDAEARGVDKKAGLNLFSKPDVKAVRNHPGALLVGVAALVATLGAFVALIEAHGHPARELVLFSVTLVLMGFASVAIRMRTTRIWVECKARPKTGITVDDLYALKGKVQAMTLDRVVSLWKPTTVYLVSSTPFDTNILRHAHSLGIFCFEEQGTEEERRTGRSWFVERRRPPNP